MAETTTTGVTVTYTADEAMFVETALAALSANQHRAIRRAIDLGATDTFEMSVLEMAQRRTDAAYTKTIRALYPDLEGIEA